jgi:ethanolamine utilization microcompartment shell protein EutL
MSIGARDIIDDAMAAAKLSLDSVYVVWSEQDIMFKRNAISFDPSINLSNNAGKSSSPAIASSPAIVSDNNVYVVWDDDTGGNSEILYRRSTDGGATFGGTVNLSNNTGYSSIPAIAAYANNVYVVWNDDTGGNPEILYRKSTDGGDSFGGTMNLSNTTGQSGQPAIAAFGDVVIGQSVYVVWTDDTPGPGNSEILYRRSTDGGATFGGTVNLSNTTGNSNLASVAVSGNYPSQQQDVYVMWSDGTRGILYRKSTDSGATFGRTVSLTSGRAYATVAVSGNNVYVVWSDDTLGTGNFEILYEKSTDGGATFGGTVNLSNTTENSGSPHVATSSNLSL